MATREENIKKINEQLEQLTDEQLDEIAGGFFRLESKDGKESLESSQRVRKSSAHPVPEELW